MASATTFTGPLSAPQFRAFNFNNIADSFSLPDTCLSSKNSTEKAAIRKKSISRGVRKYHPAR